MKNEHFGHVEMQHLPLACSLRCHADNFFHSKFARTNVRPPDYYETQTQNESLHIKRLLRGVDSRFLSLLFSDFLSK